MDEWLTPKEVADHLRTSIHMVRKLTRAQRLPQPVKLGSRTLRWRRADIDAHLAPQTGERSVDRMLGIKR